MIAVELTKKWKVHTRAIQHDQIESIRDNSLIRTAKLSEGEKKRALPRQ